VIVRPADGRTGGPSRYGGVGCCLTSGHTYIRTVCAKSIFAAHEDVRRAQDVRRRTMIRRRRNADKVKEITHKPKACGRHPRDISLPHRRPRRSGAPERLPTGGDAFRGARGRTPRTKCGCNGRTTQQSRFSWMVLDRHGRPPLAGGLAMTMLGFLNMPQGVGHTAG
jgi:hypothetical protein